MLDDFDVLSAIKQWQFSDDDILADLSKRLINRRLFKSQIKETEYTESELEPIRKKLSRKLGISVSASRYYLVTDSTSNFAYYKDTESIQILYKDGSLVDIAHAADNLHIEALSRPVVKYFLCYPES